MPPAGRSAGGSGLGLGPTLSAEYEAFRQLYALINFCPVDNFSPVSDLNHSSSASGRIPLNSPDEGGHNGSTAVAEAGQRTRPAGQQNRTTQRSCETPAERALHTSAAARPEISPAASPSDCYELGKMTTRRRGPRPR